MAQREHAGGYTLNEPVFFIGFMGAGKTSVSRFLAKTCGLVFIDADEYLELLEGRTIADIFAEDGEDHFRDLETRCLEELARRKPRLIGCGGGVVKRPENIRIMNQSGYVVHLGVTAEVAAERVAGTKSRPLFKNLEVSRKTVAEREPLYDQAADVRVETTGRSVPEIATEIHDILLERGILTRGEQS